MKSSAGNFFEDFALQQQFVHAPPRTLTVGDAALYKAIYGARFAPQSSELFALGLGHCFMPLDDLLVFHTVFGMSVSDISLNAVANLGYAQVLFGKPLYPGATLTAHSQVIGLKENSDQRTGIVYVRTRAVDIMDDEVLSYVRWVMVRKRGAAAPAPETIVPELQSVVPPASLVLPKEIDFKVFLPCDSGSALCWEDYEIGEKIDHIDGTTIEEAEHAMATRLYHNTARVHFNQYAEAKGRFGRRIVYGGHVISIARALSYNGLQNAFSIAAINAGRHVNPVFAGDTIFAWSQVLDKAQMAEGCGALRLRLVATKNLPCGDFPESGENVVLDLDYWALLPHR